MSNDPGVLIPQAFWKTLSPEEMIGVVKRNGLDAVQCARVWKMLGRTDPCPVRLDLFVSRADVDSMIDRLRKQHVRPTRWQKFFEACRTRLFRARPR